MAGETDGMDDYAREWRVAPTGTEHIVEDAGHLPSNPLTAMVRSRAGSRWSYCGRDVTDMPPSPDKGERKPCGRCVHNEVSRD